ncbi:MAG: hypothetical protein ABFC24_03755 [Methanoregulaceae archaeon]
MFFAEPLIDSLAGFLNGPGLSAVPVPGASAFLPFTLILGVSVILGLIVLAIFLAKRSPLFARGIWIIAIGAGILIEGLQTIGIPVMWITFTGGVAGLYFLSSAPHPNRA